MMNTYSYKFIILKLVLKKIMGKKRSLTYLIHKVFGAELKNAFGT